MNDFLKIYIEKLKANFPNPELELRVLLNKCSINKKQIILSNFNIKDIDTFAFNNAFERRINGEPISKIFNLKSFWKYDFFVDNNVLDPRPETELIIEKVLKYFPNFDKPIKILDMCTGSGCLAISLAKEYINCKVVATDISKQALNIAKYNAKKLGCSKKINFINCDLINNIQTFDIIVSNPPYLSNLDYSRADKEIKLYEPKIALLAFQEGYEYYNRISKLLPKLLTKKSKAFLEIGFSQTKKIISILKSNNINCLKIAKDIQDLDRVLILNKP
tara:strand:+ start:691 stop:1518 length:828 start_codon:yes stop_codon:yes gene_type:complete